MDYTQEVADKPSTSLGHSSQEVTGQQTDCQHRHQATMGWSTEREQRALLEVYMGRHHKRSRAGHRVSLSTFKRTGLRAQDYVSTEGLIKLH